MGFQTTALKTLWLFAIASCVAAAPRPEPPAASRSSLPVAAASGNEAISDLCAGDLGAPNRRLTRFELAHAVEDVFGVDASVLRALPAPAASIGNVPDILVGRLLDTSPRFLEPYRAAVEKLATDASARLAPSCSGEKAHTAGAARGADADADAARPTLRGGDAAVARSKALSRDAE